MLRVTLILFCALGLVGQGLYAQRVNDIFNPSTPIYFLGVDFSGAYLIAPEGTWDPEGIESWMQSINELIVVEPSKYRIANAIKRKSVENKVEVANTRNARINTDEMLATDYSSLAFLKRSDIATIMGDYDYKGLSGIGLIFNIEAFNKFTNTGTMWVTFVDTRSGEVFFTERMNGKSGGFGLRNFWAASIYNVIKDIEKGTFSQWKAKYGSQ
jgi:hypothetical protein